MCSFVPHSFSHLGVPRGHCVTQSGKKSFTCVICSSLLVLWALSTVFICFYWFFYLLITRPLQSLTIQKVTRKAAGGGRVPDTLALDSYQPDEQVVPHYGLLVVADMSRTAELNCKSWHWHLIFSIKLLFSYIFYHVRSAIQSVVKVINIAEDRKYIQDGLTHTWVGFYRARVIAHDNARQCGWYVLFLTVFYLVSLFLLISFNSNV